MRLFTFQKGFSKMKFLKRASIVLFAALLLGFAACPANSHAATKITISNVKAPASSLVKGKSVSLRGIIKSNSKITKVTGKIVKSSNKKTYFSKTVKPKSYSYSLAGPIDSTLKFGKLPTGKYSYVVTATTASGVSKKVINKTFRVVKTASKMSVSPKIGSSTITKGKGTLVYGYVKSNYKITKVTAQIVGTTYVKTVKPNAKSFNLVAVDSAMKFSKLNVGTYNLKVTAADSSGTTKSKKVACTVTSSSSVTSSGKSNSKLTVSPKVSPSTATAGTGIFVYGTVTSNYKITSVTAEIVGTGYKKTVSPKSLSYNLAGMDSAMKFSALSAGVYVLQVTAKDASGNQVTGQTTCTLTARNIVADGTANAMVNVALSEPNANVGLSNKYNNYSGAAWCAYFVAWCARESGVSTTAIPNSYLCRNLVSYYQGLKRYYTYAKVKAGTYTPKKGDLIFYSKSRGGTASHIGIVTSVNTSTKQITTKEGNTNTSSGGSWVYSYTMSYASDKPWSGYSQYIIGYAHPGY